MGKLVLTRRAGESVKLTEPNGREWLLTVNRMLITGRPIVSVQGYAGHVVKHKHLYPNQAILFAGGNVELRPHKRPDQAILAFDFPRDVTIVRTEIA